MSVADGHGPRAAAHPGSPGRNVGTPIDRYDAKRRAAPARRRFPRASPGASTVLQGVAPRVDGSPGVARRVEWCPSAASGASGATR